MAEIPSSEPESQQRLSQVKDVLKNSKTLKEQLKGVCTCYDEFVSVQKTKEDQKSMSLMKNFFLQIVNKSQGEILKYKQAYEQQREKRKEMETKIVQQQEEIQKLVQKNFLETQKSQKEFNEREKKFQQELLQERQIVKVMQDKLKKQVAQVENPSPPEVNSAIKRCKSQMADSLSVPQLDLSKVLPNFSLKQQ